LHSNKRYEFKHKRQSNMTEKTNYLDCWIRVAGSLFSQALPGEPTLADSLPKPMSPGSFGFAARLEGEEEGNFSVFLDGTLSTATLFGEGVDQRAGWGELLQEVASAAAGELLAKTGRLAQVKSFLPFENATKMTRAFQLKSGDQLWSLQVNNEVRLVKSAKPVQSSEAQPDPPVRSSTARNNPVPAVDKAATSPDLTPGLQLLLDVELEASLRFGAREMPLMEILDLGPGDVVQLDRHIHDPVDLIVGDKIVARGEVVLVNGNFGLRVTEVAAPERRLESIRCLF
jgi:flagellar motor switch protein FliN